MRRVACFLPVLIFLFIASSLHASTVVSEMNRVAGEVAKLDLTFGKYVLGSKLTAEQKKLAQKTLAKRALEGTYKFKDGEQYVIATEEEDLILGMYKEFPEVTKDQMKSVIGELMFQFGEPTAMAHEKLIYWAYDKNGIVGEDVFEFARQNGGTETLATVKFASSERVTPDGPPSEKAKDFEKDVEDEGVEKKSSVYVMITSDPLSKLFLVHTSPKKK